MIQSSQLNLLKDEFWPTLKLQRPPETQYLDAEKKNNISKEGFIVSWAGRFPSILWAFIN